ncbi:MAG: hypothetical protein ACLRNA_03815 [Gemmiger formicilis]|uniref:hypothetical protein n=1 Tax=Gemmiger formicilis TaxID=745368 RepID=UPI003A37AC72
MKDAYEHEKARAKASGTELPTPPEAGIDAKLEMLMTECDGHAETEDAEILHARKRFEELCEEFTPEVKREAELSAMRAACSSSAPSATRAAVSTTSCAAVQAVRATRVHPASS